MKKITVYLLVGMLVLGIGAATLWAAPSQNATPDSNAFCPGFSQRDVQRNSLTDEQKQAFDQFHQQMIASHQELLQKEVTWGWITQEQADAQIQRMNEWSKNGFGPGMMGPGMMGPGRQGGMGTGMGMMGNSYSNNQ